MPSANLSWNCLAFHRTVLISHISLITLHYPKERRDALIEIMFLIAFRRLAATTSQQHK